MFPEKVAKELEKRGLIAVVEISDANLALPTAKALMDGGVSVIEFELRTDAAEKAIARVVEEMPEMYVGAGTIILRDQAQRMSALGVHYGISPGFNPRIVKDAQDCALPFIPGVATPSELENAIAFDCNILKFFPAMPLGGVRYLHSLAAPYRHLGLKYIPLGGIGLDNLTLWAKEMDVIAVGGTWIAAPRLIADHSWKEITKNARQAKFVWDNTRTES